MNPLSPRLGWCHGNRTLTPRPATSNWRRSCCAMPERLPTASAPEPGRPARRRPDQEQRLRLCHRRRSGRREVHLSRNCGAARPLDSIVGEEGAGFAGTSGRVWVIDPVDGTFNFASGSTYWCAALALAQLPAGASPTPETLGDARGAAGWRVPAPGGQAVAGRHCLSGNAQRRPIHVDARHDLAQLSAGTYLHPTWLAEPRAAVPWQHAAVLPATLRMLGSGSCDLARVAQGNWVCGSSTAARPGTGSPARGSSARPAGTPPWCGSTGWTGSWRARPAPWRTSRRHWNRACWPPAERSLRACEQRERLGSASRWEGVDGPTRPRAPLRGPTAARAPLRACELRERLGSASRWEDVDGPTRPRAPLRACEQWEDVGIVSGGN